MKRAKGKSNIDIVRDMQAGIRPFTQVSGFNEKPTDDRQVGDTWEDSRGQSWIKTEYGSRSHNPTADAIKEETNKKWSCKRCSKDFRWNSTKLDEKMLNKTSMCFDCVVEYETELKLSGKFNQYASRKVLENKLAYAIDMSKRLRESFKYTKENKVIKYVNSNGMVEEWENTSRDELMKDMLKDYKSCLRVIQEIKKELSEIPDIGQDFSKKMEFQFVPRMVSEE